MKMPEAAYKFKTKKFMTIVQKIPHKIRKRMKQSPVLIDVSALLQKITPYRTADIRIPKT